MVKNIRTSENFKLNFGPQHPAAHGVLRLVLELVGETVQDVDVHIGLLHRGTERLIEYKNITQAVPYFDRLDYVSTMAQEHSFVAAVEKTLSLTIPRRSQYIRVLGLELTRILNHLLAITTHALDVGAITPFLWGFEEREKIMEFYEALSGARLHSNFFRVGGVTQDIPFGLINEILIFCKDAFKKVDELEELLTTNRIWCERLVGVGQISSERVLALGFTGVMARGSGLLVDLRKTKSYEAYSDFDFSIPITYDGDCYDRFLIRVEEIRQSLSIIIQALERLPNDDALLSEWKYVNPKRELLKTSMESLIHHFKYFSENFYLNESDIYLATEAPKGEFGVYLMGDNSNKTYRCRIRSPGLFHLQGLNEMSTGLLLADLVTIIGTQDIVFGEVDR